MGETRVDLLHLLEDLRDAYSGALEETILTEIVANSLDSGARRISLRSDPILSTLTIVDDGAGMLRRDLSRFHDIASSTKTRGEGIGFAGVGIKLSLLLCEEVVTETRRGKVHVASRWHLASRHKAPWKWVPPPGVVTARGTAVSLRLSNALSALLDPGFLEGTLRRHFTPLFDPRFSDLLAPAYGQGVRFEINDLELPREEPRAAEVATIEVRIGRKRKPSASGLLIRESAPLAEDQRGVAVSTRGKVIRRGWDWLGITPASPDRIGGLIEVPALAECLTLNKADFIRTGTRGAIYLSYRKALQEAVAAQLAAWGDAQDVAEQSRRRAARPVERDLERVLVELADEFPLIAALVERRPGGQRKLPIGEAGGGRALVAASAQSARMEREETPSPSETPGPAEGPDPSETSTTAIAESPDSSATPEPGGPPAGHPFSLSLPGTKGERKPARYGLSIQFEKKPETAELGRLQESTIWVNESHPAYRRAVSSRSEGYHVALSVAMALAPLAVEAASERAFVNSFLEHWGEALTNGRRK